MDIPGLAQKMRKQIKSANIDVRVRTFAKSFEVQVISPTFEKTFSDAEQIKIKTIAKAMGFTMVLGIEIETERCTNPNQMNFYKYPAGYKLRMVYGG